jgi:hypothetical protein
MPWHASRLLWCFVVPGAPLFIFHCCGCPADSSKPYNPSNTRVHHVFDFASRLHTSKTGVCPNLPETARRRASRAMGLADQPPGEQPAATQRPFDHDSRRRRVRGTLRPETRRLLTNSPALATASGTPSVHESDPTLLSSLYAHGLHQSLCVDLFQSG